MDNAARQLTCTMEIYVRVNNLCPGLLKSHVVGVSAKQVQNFKNLQIILH